MTNKEIQDYKDKRNLDKGFNTYWNKGFDEAVTLLNKREEAIDYAHSSTLLKEKYKTDFDVWAINKGYTKMEGEWVKDPETYNEEFLLQMYSEELENL